MSILFFNGELVLSLVTQEDELASNKVGAFRAYGTPHSDICYMISVFTTGDFFAISLSGAIWRLTLMKPAKAG